MTRYLIVFSLITILTALLCIPLHSLSSEQLLLLADYPKSQGQILIFGNSVNGTISRCDRDWRTLPALAAAEAGAPIVNLSRGGMTLGQMLQLAEAGARTGLRPATMVFPLSPEAGFLRSTSTPYGLQAYLTDNFGAMRRPADGPASEARNPPEAYRGQQYGSYAYFSKQYFPREKAAASCPGTAGADRDFVEFMYWRNYLQGDDPLGGLADVLPRINHLRQQNINVVFWMMPVNFDDLRALHGATGAAQVQQEIGQVRTTLEHHGFPVLDSSQLVASSGFTDRWCACGHLGEQGRRIAAASLATWIGRQQAGPTRQSLTAAN